MHLKYGWIDEFSERTGNCVLSMPSRYLVEIYRMDEIGEITQTVHKAMLYYVSEGRSLKDDVTLGSLDLEAGGKLYFKDLGPQVGWTTVSTYMYCYVLGGRSCKDDVTLGSLDLGAGGKLYFKDLGPQVGWTTVSTYM